MTKKTSIVTASVVALTLAFVVTLVRSSTAGGTDLTCAFVPPSASGGNLTQTIQTSTCPISSGNNCTPVSLQLSWGDGAISYGTAYWANDNTTFQHTYSSPGTYTLTLFGANNQGNTCDISSSFSW